MSNEFIHTSVGTAQTQAEFEHIGLHVFNNQATGDLLYSSSATQNTRLGIGSTNQILTVIGGVPTWQSTLAGLTLTSPVINGTITTTGLTLPAITLGGTVTGGNQNISSIANLGVGNTAVSSRRLINADITGAPFLVDGSNSYIGTLMAVGGYILSPSTHSSYVSSVVGVARIDGLNTGDWTYNTGGVKGLSGWAEIELGATGTITAITAIHAGIQLYSVSGVTLTNAYGLYVEAITTAGTVPVNNFGIYIEYVQHGSAYNYGLKMGNISGGTAGNYAIYTGTGDVRFGGALTLVGHIGIGQASDSNYGINYIETFTDTANSQFLGVVSGMTLQKTSAAYASNSAALYGAFTVGAANTQNWTHAIGGKGLYCYVATAANSSGTITGLAGIYTLFGINGGVAAVTVTNLYGIYIPALDLVGNSHLTNCYGIYIGAQAGGATLNYNIYSAGGKNRFTGTMEFGTYAAGAATDSIGYITINDAAGTARKLMVQA